MQSLWAQTSGHHTFDLLKEDLHTDVLVIGGGMAGILCAYLLHRAGLSYVLVEAEILGGGITQNTTAKITSQHGLIFDQLVRRFGLERAHHYLEINQAALGKFRDLCSGMDCHFQEKPSYVYSLTDRRKMEREAAALERLGFPAEWLEHCSELPFPVTGALKFPDQAQFHPLKFIQALAQAPSLYGGQVGYTKGAQHNPLHIYEHTPVRELIGTTAITDRGKITAEKIIVTTHFPFLNKHGSYFLKLYQHRSYVIALENAPNVQGMYVDEAPKGLSFRNYQDLLLLGGGDHRTGKKGGGWQALLDFAGRHYPQAKEKYRWATQDCMTLDSIPYIGPYSANTRDLYVATGFNKWGMTSSMAAAMILVDLVQELKNPYAEVFSPSRTMLRPQLAANAFAAAANLLTPAARRCPHLGCALKWNPLERTWDCPCHGSRFAADGNLLDNPATGNLKNTRYKD